MKLAVFGAAGQVGHALGRQAAIRGIALDGFDRATADITDPGAVRAALLEAGPTLAINAAAWTAVDRAEVEEEAAARINRDGAANIAEATQALSIPLIHISTDYVFDGTRQGPLAETDRIAPLGAYGRTKADGEAAVRRAAPGAIILRTAWVFGLEGANFVKTMLRLGAEREVLRVVDDQTGCPTYADDLASGILGIAAAPQPGTYHLAGSGSCTWFGFAQEIFRHAARHGLPVPRLEPIPTSAYPTPARRPANSVLDCTRAKATFGIELPPWQDGLARMLDAHWSST